MSTSQPTINLDQTKKRTACDECRSKKLKCTGEQPICARCTKEGVTCLYSLQKPMGRPRKRQRSQDAERNEDAPTERGDLLTHDIAAGFHSNATSTVAYTHPATLTTDQLFPPTWPGAPFPTPPESLPDLSLPPLNACACLSSLYLSLSSLTTLPSHSLLRALPTLATALQTAQTALLCPHCPTRFITIVQNTQVLSTLLTSLASAFTDLLARVNDKAAAVRAANLSSFECADPHSSDQNHNNSKRLAAKLPLFFLVWGDLCATCSTPHNLPSYSSDGTAYPPTLMSLVHGLKNRQERFHAVCAEIGGPFVDGRPPGESEHLCQKMAGVAGAMVEGFDWS